MVGELAGLADEPVDEHRTPIAVKESLVTLNRPQND